MAERMDGHRLLLDVNGRHLEQRGPTVSRAVDVPSTSNAAAHEAESTGRQAWDESGLTGVTRGCGRYSRRSHDRQTVADQPTVGRV